ncbi:DNA polymerase III subunit delta [Aliishimia ponticola]|uniref:DNA-directed DNA polymerase n=1 Tax=Aliishimia ponticola TaxID=2499833 RepID=A0A4S4NB74_9RHOB|nr:DNA polymerase III subunit delta [Aliishimia ponticola]THH36622.1 DNA polymerase III subunit delta [Aliishimia ponticola]
MKLSARDASSYFAKPDQNASGLLIYGADAMRIALKRQEVIKALVGPQGEEEMRLTRLPAGEVRKEPSRVLDEIKASGFFPGPRVVFVEDATEQTGPAIFAALEEWAPGDAQIIVTAGQLKATSKLRKAFESSRTAYAAGIYDDPPSREEIERILRDAGITAPDRDVMTALTDLSRELDPGDFRQTMEKLALYKLNDPAPLGAEDIAACAPASTEADTDDILNIIGEARTPEIGPLMRRLQAQGAQPVFLLISAMRHFRTLHAAACDPAGPAQGMSRMRPPVFGPRRDRMIRQAQAWGLHKLETALGIITDTDLALRSAGQTAPQMALVERAFIRLSMLGAQR